MNSYKGVILAGGQGTRFRPLTQAVNKHLFPVYDKPMIYFPLSTLMLMQIREVMIITGSESVDAFRNLLGDGTQFGMKLTYAIQDRPTGLPDGLVIAEEFLNHSPCVLALGDNVMHGQGLVPVLRAGLMGNTGASVFLYEVPDATAFGVADIDSKGAIIGLEEKPAHPKSNWAVTGLYVFDQNGPSYAKNLKPSQRGETEIVDLLMQYLNRDELGHQKLNRGVAWLDMGTPDNLLSASEYFRLLDQRQRHKVAVLEEIAWRNHWIGDDDLESLAKNYENTDYGQYISTLSSDR